MANTYTLIASNTLSSSAASVTFSSIPSTYTDLVLRLSLRTDASTGTEYALLKLNNSNSITFSVTNLIGNGSSASSARNPISSLRAYLARSTPDTTYTSNTFSSIEIYLPSYTASQNKPYSAFAGNENNSSTAYIGAHAGLAQTTSAISTIEILPYDGPNFVSGSSFFLYGIKNS